MKTFRTAGVVILVASLVGCGGGQGFVALNGKVTTPEGPLKVGIVNFYSAETGKAISAPVTDGTYRVSGELPKGKYVVFFTAPLPSDPLPGKPPVIVKLVGVPPKYRDEKSSPLIVEVKSGSEKLDLEIKP